MCKFLDFLKSVFEGSSPYKEGGLSGELPSPRIGISVDDIRSALLEAFVRVGIHISVITVAGTNSMEPSIDIDHAIIISDAVEYRGKSVIKPGDVILYKASWGYAWVIHSVIEVGEDAEGWYCKARGWNCNNPDPQIIREDQITHVALGVIWCGQEAEP